MANATPSRLGQSDAAGDPLALFLKVFAGEILTAFNRESAFRPRHMVRTIPSGKSATFPVTGLASASYHTPGAEITGGVIRHGERIISIDDLLIAPAFISNIDEAMNHFEVRSIYSQDIAQALAKAYDQDVGRTFIEAARAAAAVTGLSGGYTSNNVNYKTDGTALWQGVFNAGVALDGKDVPSGDRSAFMLPAQYALIVMSEKPINRDLNPQNVGQQGSIAMGNVERVNDIAIVKTNNLPTADDSANLALNAARRHDFSTTAAIIGHSSAAGTVQLQDVTAESAYDIRRQGTLMVGKYLVGHGPLRPEAAGELRTADPSVA